MHDLAKSGLECGKLAHKELDSKISSFILAADFLQAGVNSARHINKVCQCAEQADNGYWFHSDAFVLSQDPES